MKEKKYKLLLFLFLFKMQVFSQTIKELPPNTDVSYHDSIYYLIKNGIQDGEWNLSEIKEIKNSTTENLLNVNYANQFIVLNNILQVGDSAFKKMEPQTVTYGGVAAYKTEVFSVKKIGKGNFHLTNKDLTNVNCYVVQSTNDYRLQSSSTATYTDKISAFYFTDNNSIPVAWFAESHLTNETLRLFNYTRAFVNQGFSNIKNYNASELASAVHLKCSPNPTHKDVTITYTLPYAANVELSIKNITGTNAIVLEAANNKVSGNYSRLVSLTGYTSGIYTIQLSINSVVVTTQLIFN